MGALFITFHYESHFKLALENLLPDNRKKHILSIINNPIYNKRIPFARGACDKKSFQAY